MQQKDFQNILKKYLQGKATPEEKRLIDNWYGSMEENMNHQAIEDELGVESRLWSTISVRLKKSKRVDKVRKFHWYASRIAASIAVAVVFYYFIGSHPAIKKDVTTSEQKVSFSWKHVENTKNTPELFVLPDNSKVTIQPGGKLRFSSAFDEVIREVYLEGEAFFEVSKNAERPFLVYANDVTTKVLGTSFTVKAIQQEKQVTIAVKTGKVSVYTNNKDKSLSQNEEIILTPNQQVVVDQARKKVSKKLVDNPQVIISAEEVSRMRFEEAPVTEIFKALEKVYGVEIVFDEVLLSSCELTTIIADKDIFSRLNIICDAIGASYVLENGTIIINSTGCN
jgi:ferric-dicitrate binding protein FerR (iron transport regulator)